MSHFNNPTLNSLFSYQNISDTFDFLRTETDFQVDSSLIDFEVLDHTQPAGDIKIEDVELIDWIPNVSPHYKVTRFAVSSKSEQPGRHMRWLGLKAMCSDIMWSDKTSTLRSGGIFQTSQLHVLRSDGTKYEVEVLFRMPNYREADSFEYQPGFFIISPGELYLHLNFFGVAHSVLPNPSTFKRQNPDWDLIFFMNGAISFQELHDVLMIPLQENFDMAYRIMSFLPFDPKVIEYNFGVAISEEIQDLIFGSDSESEDGLNTPSLRLVSYCNPRLPDTVRSFEPWNTYYEDIPLKRNFQAVGNRTLLQVFK